MSTSPEIKIETPPQVEQIPEQFVETPIERAEGIQATPSVPTPPPVTAPSSAVVASVPAPPLPTGPSLVIPSDPVVLQAQSHGSIQSAQTWSAIYWLRMIKKALIKHFRIVIGGNTSDVK